MIAPPPERVVFDAVYTHESYSAHRQAARGVLRDAGGRAVGRFAFTCVGGEHERCRATGRTGDGRIALAGPARRSAAVHVWRLAGGSGAYRAARGRAVLRDVGPRETIVGLRVYGARLRAGALGPPPAAFAARASAPCARTAAALAALPAFPFAGFDPLHPDPALLPQVGAFFTGPGDPRPAMRALATRLRALGRPPALRAYWRRLLRARAAMLANIEAQDAAALAADVPGFVRTVRASSRAYGAVVLAATAFGAPACGG